MGGLLGVVEAYCYVIEDQGRGSLHVHCLVWLQGWGEVVDKIVKEGEAKNEEEAKESVATKLRTALEEMIAVDLPAGSSNVRISTGCPKCNKGQLRSIPDDDLIKLRRRGVSANETLTLVCDTCKERSGSATVLRASVARELQAAGYGEWPEDAVLGKKWADELMWHLQQESPQPGSQKGNAALAFLTLQNNSHSCLHNPSCFKKTGNNCRYNVPHLPSVDSCIRLDKDAVTGSITGIVIQSKRAPESVYVTPSCPDLTEIFACNNNLKFVNNHLLAYYLGRYMSKYSKENADRTSDAEAAIRRYCEKQQMQMSEQGMNLD